MKIEISEELSNNLLNPNEIKEIIREIKKEVSLKEGERFPENLSFFPQMTVLPYARYNKKEVHLEVYMPRLFLSKSYLRKKETKAMIKYILTHELIEPIERKTISGALKAWFSRSYYTLVPITFPSLKLTSSDLSLEAFSEDICEDIITDRRALYSEEQELGFSLIHKEILEVEKYHLKKLSIEKINNKFYSNIQPYELICWILSGMRKAVVNRKNSKYFLGRFQSHILLQTICKKIKYPQLREVLYLIFNELKKKKANYKLVYQYSMNFVSQLEYKDL